MLANVLKSQKARQTSVAVVRAFTLKQFILNYKELAEKLKELESKYNKQFKDIYEAIIICYKKINRKTNINGVGASDLKSSATEINWYETIDYINSVFPRRSKHDYIF
jgi:hypothetical protein